MRNIAVFLMTVCLGLALSACDGDEGSSGTPSRGGDTSGGGKPVIAVTIFPLADITRQIVGEHAEVVCLVPPGITPHGYEPNAEQMAVLGRAKMLVMVGGGFDRWAERTARAAGNDSLRVVRFESLVDAEAETETEHDEHDAHAHEHVHGPHCDHGPGGDPHVWFRLEHHGRISSDVARHASEVIPEYAQVFRDNRGQHRQAVAALHREFKPQFESAKTHKLVTFHGAFNRLTEDFGLEVVATLMPVEGPGAMTSGRLDQAIKAIKEHDLKVIFTEPQFPPDAAEELAKQTGVKVMMLDPLGDPNVPGRSTYLKMMRYNLRTLVEGLNL